MSRYFMRETPLWAMEHLMMSQPGHKPRGGGMYRPPHSITRQKMWSANTARTMTERIRAFCVNAPVWRSESRQVYWS